MAYRAATPAEAIVVHDGWIVIWRGLVAAAVAAAAAATVHAVAGWMGFALYVPLSGLALFALGSTLRRVRRLTVRVLPRARIVLVTERGIGHRAEREVEVDDEAALRLDVARDESWLAHLPAPRLRCTALRVGTHHATAELTSRLPGLARHRAIAERLRELLALEPPTTVEEASTPSAWPNVRVYVLVAMGLTAVSLIGFALEGIANRNTGRMDVICVEPCRVLGMDCLPGGTISSRHEPGEQVVFVADPASPTGERAVAIPIRVDHVSRFECRADAVPPVPVPER